MQRKISVFGFEGMICDKEGPTKWEDALSPSNKTEFCYRIQNKEPRKNIILDSSMVEHSAVNRVVVGSSPTRGVFFFLGSMVKRLRHRPFTAVTRVQIPLESFLAQQCAELKVISRMPMWLNWQSS